MRKKNLKFMPAKLRKKFVIHNLRRQEWEAKNIHVEVNRGLRSGN